jgi:hypothetical protein
MSKILSDIREDVWIGGGHGLLKNPSKAKLDMSNEFASLLVNRTFHEFLNILEEQSITNCKQDAFYDAIVLTKKRIGVR